MSQSARQSESVECRLCGESIDSDWDCRVDHLSREHDLFQAIVESMTVERGESK